MVYKIRCTGVGVDRRLPLDFARFPVCVALGLTAATFLRGLSIRVSQAH